MKILVIANMYPSADDPSYGTFIRNFYEDFARRNSQGSTRLVTIYGRRPSKMAKLFAYVSFYARALKALLFSSYDLIYVHTVTFPTPALRVASVFRRLPLILNVHGDDVLPQTRLKKRLKEWSRPLVGMARMVVVPSEYFKGVLLTEFGNIGPDRVFVSPSGGVSDKFFNRRDAGVGHSDMLTLGFVSRVDPGKGWDIFLRACRSLVDLGVPVRGIMAGGGAQQQQLRAMITELGLDSHVEFLGPLSQQRLIEVYRGMDLFVFPTVREQESLGLVAIEAMACGTPVAASDMAGPAGYVINGVNGYLFTPGDSDDLVRAVKSYMALSDEEKRCMSESAYRTAGAYEADSVSARLYERVRDCI